MKGLNSKGTFQKYNLHLINGDVIVVEEDYFLQAEFIELPISKLPIDQIYIPVLEQRIDEMKKTGSSGKSVPGHLNGHILS